MGGLFSRASSTKPTTLNMYTSGAVGGFDIILIDASQTHIEVTLPKKIEKPITLVAINVDYGISIKAPEGKIILDSSNIDFSNTGDSLTFQSNQEDLIFCTARYTAHMGY